MNALKYHWYETSLLSQAVLKCVHGVQRFHLQEVCARDWFHILPRMKKSITLFHIKNFSCHVILQKISQVGPYVGHIRIVLSISG